MYEELTALLPKLKEKPYSEWYIREDDPEGVCQPNIEYIAELSDLWEAALRFIRQHPDTQVGYYEMVLEEAGLRHNHCIMRDAATSGLDGRTVMALIVGAFRAEHFCDGALMDFCDRGCFVRWLERLKDIDEGDTDGVKQRRREAEMMMAPKAYIDRLKEADYLTLINERNELIQSIRRFERDERRGDRSGEEWKLLPNPETAYQMNLEYLAVLCRMMQDRYSEVYVREGRRLSDDTRRKMVETPDQN